VDGPPRGAEGPRPDKPVRRDALAPGPHARGRRRQQRRGRRAEPAGDARRRPRTSQPGVHARGRPAHLRRPPRSGRSRGRADLLRLEAGGYVPGDIKSGAAEEGPSDDRRPKKQYAMQLALYVDALDRLGLRRGPPPRVRLGRPRRRGRVRPRPAEGTANAVDVLGRLSGLPRPRARRSSAPGRPRPRTPRRAICASGARRASRRSNSATT